MTISAKEAAVFAGIETTAGAGPAGGTLSGTAAVEVSDLSIEPMKSDKKSRNIKKPWAGASPSKQANIHRMCKFKCDFAGAGGALGDVVPAWSTLHRMCQMTMTVDSTVGSEAVTFVGNNPSSQVSGAIHYHLGPDLYKLYGAQGSVSLEFKAGEIPHWVYDFTGLWSDAVPTALPAADYTQWNDPDIVSDGYTPTFRLNGIDLVLDDLSINFGQQVKFKDRPNQKAVKTPDRETTGSATFENRGVAVMDVQGLARAGTMLPFLLEHGTTTGRTLIISAGFVQITDPTLTEIDGESYWKAGLNFVNSDGSGDWEITVK